MGTSSDYDSLSIEEFVKGCQIMSSPAKTYDLKFMELAQAEAAQKMQDWQEHVGEVLSHLGAKLDEVASHFRSPAAAAAKVRTQLAAAPLEL